ncbi:hypothetical protein FOL47_008932 [Perkinsus chesapeaki]|uniref:Right handed beta helix domain-containing protein n=1 Tax=Perkinsus chesapeaki TaxID=330153 RepID=A0A7J6N2Q2_PERCH|nr:hypothetical protein FOL47_008932 [Perkinsus chesapeaki]
MPLAGRSAVSVAVVTGVLTAITLAVLAMKRRSRAIHASLVEKLSVDGTTLISRVLDCLAIALFDELWSPSVECWLVSKEVESRALPQGKVDESTTLSVAERFPSIRDRLLSRQAKVLGDFRITERSLEQAESWWKREAEENNIAAKAVVEKFTTIERMLAQGPNQLVQPPECLFEQANLEYGDVEAVSKAIGEYHTHLPTLEGFDTKCPPRLEDFEALLQKKQEPLPLTLRAKISTLVNSGNKNIEEDLRKLFATSSTSSVRRRMRVHVEERKVPPPTDTRIPVQVPEVVNVDMEGTHMATSIAVSATDTAEIVLSKGFQALADIITEQHSELVKCGLLSGGDAFSLRAYKDRIEDISPSAAKACIETAVKQLSEIQPLLREYCMLVRANPAYLGARDVVPSRFSGEKHQVNDGKEEQDNIAHNTQSATEWIPVLGMHPLTAHSLHSLLISMATDPLSLRQYIKQLICIDRQAQLGEHPDPSTSTTIVLRCDGQLLVKPTIEYIAYATFNQPTDTLESLLHEHDTTNTGIAITLTRSPQNHLPDGPSESAVVIRHAGGKQVFVIKGRNIAVKLVNLDIRSRKGLTSHEDEDGKPLRRRSLTGPDEMRGCISCFTGHGISASHVSRLKIGKSIVQNCSMVAIRAEHDAAVYISSTTIQQCGEGMFGLVKATIEVQNTVLRHLAGPALSVMGAAVARGECINASDCCEETNGIGAAIMAREASKLVLTSVEVLSNRASGIHVVDHARCRIRHSRIESNAKSGIVVSGSVSDGSEGINGNEERSMLLDTIIHQNGSCGIELLHCIEVDIARCSVSGHGRRNVVSHDPSSRLVNMDTRDAAQNKPYQHLATYDHSHQGRASIDSSVKFNTTPEGPTGHPQVSRRDSKSISSRLFGVFKKKT